MQYCPKILKDEFLDIYDIDSETLREYIIEGND
jgi:hypothetical protein